MKRMMMGLAFILVISGCGDDKGSKDDPVGKITVINSAESTFRIVKIYAGDINSIPVERYMPNGIHKGKRYSFWVDYCDGEWIVDVIYNDPGSTKCEHIYNVPCDGNTDFLFNNTEC